MGGLPIEDAPPAPAPALPVLPVTGTCPVGEPSLGEGFVPVTGGFVEPPGNTAAEPPLACDEPGLLPKVLEKAGAGSAPSLPPVPHAQSNQQPRKGETTE